MVRPFGPILSVILNNLCSAWIFSFYIVLNGRVSVFINNAISDEDEGSGHVQRMREAEDAAAQHEGLDLDLSAFGNHINSIGTMIAPM